MAHMPEPVVIRKSPIVIIWNLIAVQFAASGIYFLAASIAYYAEIWRGLPWADSVSFQVAQVAFVFLVEVALIFYIFLMWWRQTIRLTDEQLQEHHGVLLRRHRFTPRSRIASAVFRQNPFSKLVHYGTVLLYDEQGSVLAKLGSMPEPEEFVALLMGRTKNEHTPVVPKDPRILLEGDEHEKLERKSTFRWDLNGAKVNRNLERSAMKTVAAFLNSDGGHLLLGVGDDHSSVGLEHDYATLVRKDADGFTNHFGNIFNTMLGPHLRHLVRLQPFTHDGKECMLVAVAPSGRPAYLNDEGKEEFFIRTGNGTTSLKLSEAAAYIETRWGSKN